MSAKAMASRSSFFTRRCPQLGPWGLARCTRAPLACNRSTTQYHPYVASTTTSGSGPASATARRDRHRVIRDPNCRKLLARRA
jgi:hypothetical protein